MKRIYSLIITAFALLACSQSIDAQYAQIASRIPGLIQPALSGSLNYKGYVELSGVAGVGTNKANFVGISTTQGFRYASWFFMGVGLGVDMVRSNSATPNGGGFQSGQRSFTQTKAMIPVFTDFRFNLGNASRVSAVIDVKLGASWLLGNSYLSMETAYLSTATQFYMRPSIGVRIPVKSDSMKNAVNVMLTYQLLTNNNNYYYYNSVSSPTLSAVGVTLGYEW